MKKSIPALTAAQIDDILRDHDTDRAQARKDAAKERLYRKRAYHERNLLIAALSRLFPSHLTPAASRQATWRWVVCIHVPEGQVSWHVPDDELTVFDHLERLAAHHYDGHSIQEKWARLAALDQLPVTTH